MTQPEEILAGILRSGARALAGYAAGEDDVAEEGTSLPAAAGQFDGWHDILTARVEELAVALSAGQPDLLTEQFRWARVGLAARGIPAERLRARLEALRTALSEQVPPDLAPLATAYLDNALAGLDGEPTSLGTRLTADTPDERLAAQFLVAVLEGDRRRGSCLILDAAAAGRSLSDLYLQVLQPAQQELGRMWLLGEINVAEEHFASVATRQVMAQLHARAELRPANGKTLVAAAVAGNQHDLGIQMVADLFETEGWRVIQLGANVPAEDLAEAVEFYHADLVALSISLVTQLPALASAISAVRAGQRGTGVKILVGGMEARGVAEFAISHGADAFPQSLREAVAKGAELVARG
jgi:MerR family transcriptional regulator, light-induced transcriptional regulator